MSADSQLAATRAIQQFNTTGVWSNDTVVNGIKFFTPHIMVNGQPVIPTVYPKGVAK